MAGRTIFCLLCVVLFWWVYSKISVTEFPFQWQTIREIGSKFDKPEFAHSVGKALGCQASGHKTPELTLTSENARALSSKFGTRFLNDQWDILWCTCKVIATELRRESSECAMLRFITTSRSCTTRQYRWTPSKTQLIIRISLWYSKALRIQWWTCSSEFWATMMP